MSNFWKAVIVISVIVIAAVIVVPKMIGTNQTDGANSTSAGSSLPAIEKTLENGKPTLLLLRSSN
ncbi:MAG: hypothetical protein WC891_03290 [Actinomycetota bacterium]